MDYKEYSMPQLPSRRNEVWQVLRARRGIHLKANKIEDQQTKYQANADIDQRVLNAEPLADVLRNGALHIDSWVMARACSILS